MRNTVLSIFVNNAFFVVIFVSFLNSYIAKWKKYNTLNFKITFFWLNTFQSFIWWKLTWKWRVIKKTTTKIYKFRLIIYYNQYLPKTEALKIIKWKLELLGAYYELLHWVFCFKREILISLKYRWNFNLKKNMKALKCFESSFLRLQICFSVNMYIHVINL